MVSVNESVNSIKSGVLDIKLRIAFSLNVIAKDHLTWILSQILLRFAKDVIFYGNAERRSCSPALPTEGTSMTELPSILGMHFRPGNGATQTAPLNPDFWVIFNAERDELRSAGLSVTKDGQEWCLFYDPRWDRAGTAVNLLPQLEAAYMSKIEEARAEKAAREQAVEFAHDRAVKEYNEWLEENEALIRVTILRANHLLSTFGKSVQDKARLASWVAKPPSKIMINKLKALCDAADLKIARTSRKIEANGGVDWPEDVVIRAVELLTLWDVDGAEDANGVGWSAAHSSSGHWCYGALQDPRYRDRALMLARHLIGHYIGQLTPAITELQRVDLAA